MIYKDKRCESCLGALKQISDNKYRCEACGQEYVEHVVTDEEIIWLASANKILRMGNFDDAYEEFQNIVSKYPKNYEAYYGMCLCTHGVLFVDDVLENKKVPTCYNISNSSIFDDINFKKVLELCPKELKQNYLEQAKKIDAIRIEWLEKASKEKPYDVFISYKQSDKENGIKETNDSHFAFHLYHHLTYKLGLKVFFSAETLKGKISEQYEPYIYNALNTSKIMIVYGENPDYINSTWVKNEWSRYLKSIKNNKKAKNSLVVVYKGFDPYLLPKELKNLQALNAENFDFLDTLVEHINKVLEEEEGKQKLTRKEIKVGQVATRSKTIGPNQIVKRVVGSDYVSSSDITIINLLKSIEILINNGRFDMAKTQLDKVFEQEPNNGSALYLKYLIDNKISGTEQLQKVIITGERKINVKALEDLIVKIDKVTASKLLKSIKNALIEKIDKYYVDSTGFVYSKFEDEVLELFNLLSLYEYEGSYDLNKKILEASAVNDAYLKLFNQALRTLDSTDVDDYVYYHSYFVTNIEDDNDIDPKYVYEFTGKKLNTINEIKEYILKRALAVDEGNTNILNELFTISYDTKYLEDSLKYTKDKLQYKQVLKEYLDRYLYDLNAPYFNMLEFVSNNDQDDYNRYLTKRYRVIKSKFTTNDEISEKSIQDAIKILKQLIIENGETSDKLFDLFMYQLGCVCDDDLIEYPSKLSDMAEVSDLLPRLDESDQNRLIELMDEQEKYMNQIQEEEEEERLYLKEEKKQKIITISQLCFYGAAIFLSIFFLVLIVIKMEKFDVYGGCLSASSQGLIFLSECFFIVAIVYLIIRIKMYKREEDFPVKPFVIHSIVFILYIVASVFSIIKVDAGFNFDKNIQIIATDKYINSSDEIVIDFEIINDGPINVSKIYGTMYFYEEDNLIAEYTVTYSLAYEGNSTKEVYVKFDYDRELYNCDYESLSIKYEIQEIYYSGDSSYSSHMEIFDSPIIKYPK